MAGKPVPGLFEVTITRKDCLEIPLELTGAFTTYKGEHANVVYIRDISQRKKTELALKEYNELYQTIFETTGTAMAIVEGSGALSLVNNEWEKLYGYSAAEALGLHYTKFVAPRARKLVQP